MLGFFNSIGQQSFTTPGTYTLEIPQGVFEIYAIAVGAGGGGGGANVNDSRQAGGGGALSYSNAIPVFPGETLSIGVGTGGAGGANGANGSDGLNSFVRRGVTTLVLAEGGFGGVVSTSFVCPGGRASVGTGNVKFSGGAGGQGCSNNTGDIIASGGGGAANLDRNGGLGGNGTASSFAEQITSPTDNGGYAGFTDPALKGGGGGGGVGIGTTQITTGVAVFPVSGVGGDRNSGGEKGQSTTTVNAGSGGNFGGGGGAGYRGGAGGNGGSGGVKIIWGLGRSYPITRNLDII